MVYARAALVVTVLGFPLGPAACGRAPARTAPTAPAAAAVDSDEYAVYRALLAHAGRTAVDDSTYSAPARLLVEGLRADSLRGIDSAALADLRARVARQAPLAADRLGVAVAAPGRAPGALTLSRVGMNPGRTQALVAVWVPCGPGCATGWLYVLEKRAGGWAVAQRLYGGET